ncbi:regulator of nonsense transcripts 3A [Echinococcus multilocularis]|uniref:Regulator of nonsense transcripts 3A n=1 Tax=Echinococcus multilocularis TaxID=6211 RepID=A0A0S4MM38_ECHMU|nr:regulator of nonsense transcripts 3A [Echinococcus multilocularis]
MPPQWPNCPGELGCRCQEKVPARQLAVSDGHFRKRRSSSRNLVLAEAIAEAAFCPSIFQGKTQSSILMAAKSGGLTSRSCRSPPKRFWTSRIHILPEYSVVFGLRHAAVAIELSKFAGDGGGRGDADGLSRQKNCSSVDGGGTTSQVLKNTLDQTCSLALQTYSLETK